MICREQNGSQERADQQADQGKIFRRARQPVRLETLLRRQRHDGEQAHRMTEIRELAHPGTTSLRSATSVSSLAAARMSGAASTAPVPSPSRMPSASSGCASTASSRRAWPRSAELVREHAIVARRRCEPDRRERGGACDEAVDQHRPALRRRAEHRARHHGDLATAELGQHVARLGHGAARGRARERGALARHAGLVLAGAGADAFGERRGCEAVHDQRSRSGVADAHLADRDRIRAVRNRRCGKLGAARQRRIDLSRRQRRLARGVARARSHLGGDQIRMRRQLGRDARIDHLDLDAGRGRERVDARASREERRDHRCRDARRVARHALFGEPMVGGEHQEHDALDPRREAVADQPDLHREVLDAAERAGRLRLAVDARAQRRLERAVDRVNRRMC